MTSDDDLRATVRQVIPGVAASDVSAAEVLRGEFHDVVLLPGRAVVKVARGLAAQHLERRTALLDALAGAGLPFAVPRPLSEVHRAGRAAAAVALSWVEGEPAPAGSGGARRVEELQRLLAALASVDVRPDSPVGRHLDVPHAYAGRDRWAELMAQVVAMLPDDVRDDAGARLRAALDLPPAPEGLVHGDLAGHNLRWHADGTLAGVIDWDLASAWDPAVDLGCLVWFGWDAVDAACAGLGGGWPAAADRARVWFATFRLEGPAALLDDGAPEALVAERLERVVTALRRERSAGLARSSGGAVAEGARRSSSSSRTTTASEEATVATTRTATTSDGYELWSQQSGDPAGSAVLLVMGAASSSAVWPPGLVERLGQRHRVIVWDHRDTGRSSSSAGRAPYALTDLAADAVVVLDAFGVPAAHVVGMSMGGLLTQLLMLDRAERLLSATLFCTGPLPGAEVPGGAAPTPAPELLALWAQLGDERDEAAEMDFRLRHWQLLNGGGTPFDEAEFRALEERVVAHGGPLDASSATAHARAGTSGLVRGAELRGVTVPTLVVEAPEDPAYPPPSAALLAAAIGNASTTRRVVVPGMGHALPAAVLPPLLDAVETHLDAVDRAGG
ncbi:Predicted kinase, aminoglycoside phosphotransferase (APT) family [Quadrisphaera granulorum]|uniref:Aminoglycoside phosphotransferase (APT) family kinase protein n=1 Tax=Quadrisphaera granulorum TaxID=317664 RepID=A0A316A9I4_9ACTN|nr:alpha/beta fold hydrolase [Quadrisphaera granulorum]PWJ53660.1 aminoglycoside phosphotransferase (APT) family kinase protein [Quadrisphaera granulorum]SZE96704.1 Predicted kinase, aminoglycoside phosphotransferase (APT) family [Quadrisphaera granulorum]